MIEEEDAGGAAIEDLGGALFDGFGAQESPEAFVRFESDAADFARPDLGRCTVGQCDKFHGVRTLGHDDVEEAFLQPGLDIESLVFEFPGSPVLEVPTSVSEARTEADFSILLGIDPIGGGTQFSEELVHVAEFVRLVGVEVVTVAREVDDESVDVVMGHDPGDLFDLIGVDLGMGVVPRAGAPLDLPLGMIAHGFVGRVRAFHHDRDEQLKVDFVGPFGQNVDDVNVMLEAPSGEFVGTTVSGSGVADELKHIGVRRGNVEPADAAQRKVEERRALIAKRLEEPSDARRVLTGPSEKITVAVVIVSDDFPIRASAFVSNSIDLFVRKLDEADACQRSVAQAVFAVVGAKRLLKHEILSPQVGRAVENRDQRAVPG